MVSLAIEGTQYTGIWGIYDCAYRVADVDDLITNTAGAVIGAVIAPVLLAFMPRKGTLESTRLHAKPVTKRRRIVALVVDYFVYSVATTTAVGIPAITGKMLYGSQWQFPGLWERVTYIAVAFMVVIVPALVGSGASLGQRALWLEAAYPDHIRLRALIRLFTGFGGYVVLDGLTSFGPAGLQGLFSLLFWAFTFFSAVIMIFGKTPRGLSFRLAGAQVRDSRLAPTPIRD